MIITDRHRNCKGMFQTSARSFSSLFISSSVVPASGTHSTKEQRSATAWLICTPSNPKNCGKIKIAGTKNRPVRAAALIEA